MQIHVCESLRDEGRSLSFSFDNVGVKRRDIASLTQFMIICNIYKN